MVTRSKGEHLYKVITHLEIDQYVEGNILFSEQESIHTDNFIRGDIYNIINTLNGSFTEGSHPKANYITSFTHINKTHLIVADSETGCLKILSRNTNKTSWLAGQCGLKGSVTGSFETATFNVPYKIARLPGSKTIFYITDAAEGNLRKLDLHLRNVQKYPVTDIESEYPRGLVFDSISDDHLYLSSARHLQRYEFTTFESHSVNTAITSGIEDGEFDQIEFRKLESLLFIDKYTMIGADTENNLLRVIDFNTNTSSSVCDGHQSDSVSISTDCRNHHPRSILFYVDREDRYLIVGYGDGAIRTLEITRTAGETHCGVQLILCRYLDHTNWLILLKYIISDLSLA